MHHKYGRKQSSFDKQLISVDANEKHYSLGISQMCRNREPLAELAEVTGDYKLLQQHVAFLVTCHSWELAGISEMECIISPVFLAMRPQLEPCPVLGTIL